MNFIESTSFKVLNWNISLWVFLAIFIVVALICFGLYLFFVLRKSIQHHGEQSVTDLGELKRLENFETDRNDFEMEIAKIKRIIRNQK